MYFPRRKPKLKNLPSALKLLENYNSDKEEPHNPIDYLVDVGKDTKTNVSITLDSFNSIDEDAYFIPGTNMFKIYSKQDFKKI